MYKYPITVLMPVYNAEEKEFKIAIESILNQTFSDFEFLIINDGSANNSEDIILSYKDSRIRYEKNPENIGLINTLNKGLELAKGKYIARLDQDDYSYPTRLEKQYAYMEENPNIGVSGTFVKDRTNFQASPQDMAILQRYIRMCITHSSAMIRKSVLEENNLRYNRNCVCAEDFKLWCDISRFADLAVYPEVLTIYRKTETGISQQNKDFQGKMANLIKLDNMILDFAKDKQYMYQILDKIAKDTPVTKEEYIYLTNFLECVANELSPLVSEEFREDVRIFILASNKFLKIKIQ